MSAVSKEEESSKIKPRGEEVDKGILRNKELFKRKGKVEKKLREVGVKAEDWSEETQVMNAMPPPEGCESKVICV